MQTPSSPRDVITLSCDAMGGDHGVDAVIPGAAKALHRNPKLRFHFYGVESEITAALKHHRDLAEKSVIVHTDDKILPEDKPSVALRKGKNSSMRLCIEAVANGEADAAISSGNTGALMAMAKLILRPLPSVHRPAIASILPNMQKGRTIMLDLGANLVCDAENLVQFAVLGAVFANSAYGIENPRIGILNVGTEDTKGHEVQQEAAAALAKMKLPGTCIGFVEGNDITSGRADVVVCDGFTGNIALKAIEGTGKMFGAALKEQMTASWLTKLGMLFCAGALHALKRRFDPRLYNGGPFLGLSGLCLKSHGSADAKAFANALEVAAAMVEHDFTKQVAERMAELDEQAAFVDMPSVATA